ncbi:PREDICTED: uncharacterized protein LOC108552937 [Eufriesea mexicana]|uniref:uncharacterized protein LOC108552937 n=1 Tax=Eufriesea mexicana TaxID=516756 RepID=UPI00083C7786|nr:PREDICTED: uncharacterized protein LOC108552937 [Eufriesea mexicana]
MFERSTRRFILLCLLVNAISGSPRFQSWDEGEETRYLRHATCPSCRREQPGALVSWDAPSRGEYHGLDSEPSPWQTSQPFRSNPTYNPASYDNPFSSPYTSNSYGNFPSNTYDRATRSRGTPGVAKSGATCKRENPFTIGRDLDFDVTPAQTTPIRSMSYDAMTPRFPVSRYPDRTPYRKPTFYDLIRPQSDPVSPRRPYYSLPNNQLSYGNFRRPSSFYDEPKRNPEAVYRADKHLDDSFEQENPMIQPQQPPRGWNMGNSYGRGPAAVRTQGSDRFVQPRKNQPSDTRMIYTPDVKYSPYNPAPELNTYKMMQNVGREIVNSSRWQKQLEEEQGSDAYEMNENAEQMGAGMVEEMDDGYQGNDQFGSREAVQQEEINGNGDVASEGSNSGDKSGHARNRSQGETSSQAGLLETEKITEPAARFAETTAKAMIAA